MHYKFFFYIIPDKNSIIDTSYIDIYTTVQGLLYYYIANSNNTPFDNSQTIKSILTNISCDYVIKTRSDCIWNIYKLLMFETLCNISYFVYSHLEHVKYNDMDIMIPSKYGIICSQKCMLDICEECYKIPTETITEEIRIGLYMKQSCIYKLSNIIYHTIDNNYEEYCNKYVMCYQINSNILVSPISNTIQTNQTPIVFSFCIYGNNPKYTIGLKDNLEYIQHTITIYNYYNIQVHILYDTNTINDSILLMYAKYNFVKLFKMNNDLLKTPMITRLLRVDALTDGTYFFSRDADSRITERDMYCIDAFIKSGKAVHSIRDHYYHKKRIMGGMCGIYKSNTFPNITLLYNEWKASKNIINTTTDYGVDEDFLEEVIYKQFKDNILIHSNCVGYEDEDVIRIEIKQKDDKDFVGNVYNYIDENTFTPYFNYSEYINTTHVEDLWNKKQYRILTDVCKYINIKSLPWACRAHQIMLAYMSYYYMNDVENALRLLSFYRYAHINDNIINKSSLIFDLLRKKYKIIASFNPERVPAEDEFIIQYGEYPHAVECVPTSLTYRTIYRHPIYFNEVHHDIIEYHSSWEKIDQIYILNLEERKDRYMSMLIELCRVRAPLHRVFHYKGKKDVYSGDRTRDAYIGATKNHLDVVNDFIMNSYEYCLVLEDDINFISDIRHIWNNLDTFFLRQYDFDICFTSYSKMGEVNDYDDLLLLSYQDCTTSSGYILHIKTVKKIQECLDIGVKEMIKGGDTNIYCCDRFWKRIQKDNKMFLFTRKFGYQRCTYSDIVKNVNYNFD